MKECIFNYEREYSNTFKKEVAYCVGLKREVDGDHLEFYCQLLTGDNEGQGW